MRLALMLSPGLALLIVGCAPAAPDIAVSDAWARATAPDQPSGAIYARIVNQGGADRLVGVASDAGAAMLHSNDSADGVARMRMLAELAVPAGGTVALAPGGTHIMLTGLKTPLTAASEIGLTLRFAKAGARTVKVAIVAPGAR
ncbi:MAG: copper chaperone PCu(A)C [Pseudomonadota bacterium]|nr:copper chaperone PCu(A)C [Pseudomonadota bacterium]